MDTKLTLKLDSVVIERAKEYALAHKQSLSRIIESYLQSIVNQDQNKTGDEIEISPFIKSLSSGVELPNDLDYKSDYSAHLAEKYK